METRRDNAMLDALKGAELREGTDWMETRENMEPSEPLFTASEPETREDARDSEYEERIDLWMNGIKAFIRSIDINSL